MARRWPAIAFLALLLQAVWWSAHAADKGLPAPRGLSPCAPNDPAAADAGHMASTLHGRLLGCFQSAEKIDWRGSKKPYSVPVEYAFGVEMAGGPYETKDLDKLMTEVQEQWKNSNPLSEDTRAEYDRRLGDLIEKVLPTGLPKPPDSRPSVLVSIEQLDQASFAVVTIRRRPVALNDEFFNATQVDAAAVLLRSGKLIRLALARELRSAADVASVREEIADWVYAVR